MQFTSCDRKGRNGCKKYVAIRQMWYKRIQVCLGGILYEGKISPKKPKDIIRFLGTPDAKDTLENKLILYQYFLTGVEGCTEPMRKDMNESSLEISVDGSTLKVKLITYTFY